MSNYDDRDRPAYRDEPWPRYGNRNIDKWWTPDHDRGLEALIAKWHWNWAWQVFDMAVSLTPAEIRSDWPTSSRFINNVTSYGYTRAADLGLLSRIRKPEWRRCGLCSNKFIESSLPIPLVQRLSPDQLDFCAPCLRDIVIKPQYGENASRETFFTTLGILLRRLCGFPIRALGPL